MMIFRSKIFLSLVFVLGFGTFAAAQDAAPKAEISTARLALAKQYIAAVPVVDDIKAAVAGISENIKPDQRVLFRTMADKHIDYARLTAAAELAAASAFTESELKALIAFETSPEGKTIREKMPQYQKQVQPVIAEVLQAFVTKIQDANILPQGQ
jgi:hypothetical protein